ncbi:MAG: ATP synthase F0 subunit A [Bacteroidetes bacterium QS_9_68_14]|nr:MAG: ATP synthase F0 subunit A [Bacteroidetes bacterium QS_9_68_14]
MTTLLRRSLAVLAAGLVLAVAPAAAQSAPDSESAQQHSNAQQSSHGGEGDHAEEENTGNPGAVSHSADGNYLNFEPFGIVELPRLFLTNTAGGGIGFEAFGSSKAALKSGEYTLAHPDSAGASLTDTQVQDALASSHHDYLYFTMQKAGAGSILVDFSITRHLVAVFATALLLVILALGVARRYKRGLGREEAPRGTWQNMVEVMIVFMRDEVAKPALGRHYKSYLPYLLTVFFFILIGNLLGLLPWGITATSNIMVTGTLALFTFLITQFSGTAEYWKHTLNPPGVPWFVKPFLVPAEIIGLFTKPLALAFRLFGNMMSGHIVLISMIGLIFIFTAQFGVGIGTGSIIVSVPLTIFMYGIKLAVSFIQAYIFVILSALFIGLAIEEHEDQHDEVDETEAVEAGSRPHDDIDGFMDRSEHFGPQGKRMVSGDGETAPAGQTAISQPAG